LQPTGISYEMYLNDPDEIPPPGVADPDTLPLERSEIAERGFPAIPFAMARIPQVAERRTAVKPRWDRALMGRRSEGGKSSGGEHGRVCELRGGGEPVWTGSEGSGESTPASERSEPNGCSTRPAVLGVVEESH